MRCILAGFIILLSLNLSAQWQVTYITPLSPDTIVSIGWPSIYSSYIALTYSTEYYPIIIYYHEIITIRTLTINQTPHTFTHSQWPPLGEGIYGAP